MEPLQYKNALGRINEVIRNASDLLAALGPRRLETLIGGIRQNQQALQQLLDQPRSRAMVGDLLANAARRRREARNDDGVARLYRAIESIAQPTLSDRYGIQGTDKVALENAPESLRARWLLRAENGVLVLGLQDAFELLEALGDETGKVFKALQLNDQERSPLTARNQSILAHGFEPVSDRAFEKLWTAAMRLDGFSEQELPFSMLR